MLRVYLALFVFFFCSCADETETSGNDRNTEDLNQIEPAREDPKEATYFNRVFSFFTSQDTRFSSGSFQETAPVTLDEVAAQPLDTNQLKEFYPLFIYNRDRTAAIDMYSYNYVVVRKNNVPVMEVGGPDTEVGLVDFTDNTRRRILFTGPSVVIMDAAWESDSLIRIAGAEITGEGRGIPMVFQVNLSTNLRKTFYFSDTLNIRFDTYRDPRLLQR